MKKFCMSIMTKAVKEGDINTEDVVVHSFMEDLGDGSAYVGGEGRVRSNVGGEALCIHWTTSGIRICFRGTSEAARLIANVEKNQKGIPCT